ncbi:MAG TPA: amidohydrolase family protein [Bryobacteraceae bacterium]|jgi:cytosine/adenosine deaminase-related metal-dependent hydrolase|nr:amidohydrolase family protein [Bryobacteraceae bacterium]
MTLTGARIARTAASAEHLDLHISRSRIQKEGRSGPHLDLSGHLILPGLINSHDHLEFNLFPRLGRGPYPNATAWAEDIYHPDRSPVKEHLAIPKPVRLAWGGLKNLLSGVTTVANHNPYEAEVFENNFPVRVVKRFGWAHSIRFSPDLISRYQAVSKRWPFLIHAAEGTDACAASEVHELERKRVLGRRTVLIHGVGIDDEALKILQRRRASVVWCPSSNLFTLSQTLRPEVLRSGLPVSLGTDSALTCQGDLAGEIRVARKSACLAAEDVYPMVTTAAASILSLTRGEGEIREGSIADLLAVPDSGQNPAEALQDFCPSLVILGGKIQLVSKNLAPRIDSMLLRNFQSIELEGRGSWLVNANISHLHAAVEAVLGPRFQLAGRTVRI